MAEIVCGDPENGLLLRDQTLFDHVESNVHGSETGPLAIARLEHPEFAFFNGELDVLDIAEVLLELLTHLEEFLVRLGQVLGHLSHLLRRADTGDDVFALGVDEILTVEHVLTGGRVACEGDPRS